MSLPITDCFMFFLRLPGKLGHQSYKAALLVQPVLKLKMNAVTVDGDLSNRL